MINSTAKSKQLKKNYIRIMLLCICLVLAVPNFSTGSDAFAASDISSKIKACEQALQDAADELKSMQITYDKAKAKAAGKVKVTDEDLALVGREFIDDLVQKCYEKDKDDKSAEDLVPVTKLTVAGNITKAKNNSTCKKIIDGINSSTSNKNKKFKAIINQSMSIENIEKALDFIDRCNELREKHGRKAYKVSPYLMAGAPVSAALSGRSAHVYINQGLFRTYDTTKVYENFCWAYPPTRCEPSGMSTVLTR